MCPFLFLISEYFQQYPSLSVFLSFHWNIGFAYEWVDDIQRKIFGPRQSFSEDQILKMGFPKLLFANI